MESLCVSAEEWSLFTTATVDLEAKGSIIYVFSDSPVEHRFEASVV